MNVLNTFLLVSAVLVPIVSAISAFLFRDKLKNDLAFYQGNNAELRASNADLRTEKSELQTELAGVKTSCKEKDVQLAQLNEQILRLPDLANITALISNNHKSLVTHLSDNHRQVIELLTTSKEKK